MKKKEKEYNIKCEKDVCEYKWFTKSTFKKVSCPCCGSKVENPNFKKKKTAKAV